MQTSSLITLLKKQFPDMSTQNLVDIVNEVHKICLTSKPVGQMRVMGAGDNGDVILTTTSGDKSYDIDTTNGFDYDAWRITKVYSDDDEDDVEDVVCYDATDGVSAKIVFKDDPGDTTFNIRYYRKPTEITSTSIALSIPDQYVLSHFYTGVVAFIETLNNGSFDRWLYFLKKTLSELIFNMNQTQRGEMTNTPYKGY